MPEEESPYYTVAYTSEEHGKQPGTIVYSPEHSEYFQRIWFWLSLIAVFFLCLIFKEIEEVVVASRNTKTLNKTEFNEPRHEKTCLSHMRATKAQISLRIRAVWSAPFFSLPR